MNPKWLWSLLTVPAYFLARKLRNDPQFGGVPRGDYLRRLKASPNWKNGRFRNWEKTPIQEDFQSLLGDLMGYLKAKDIYPQKPLFTMQSDRSREAPDPEATYLTWFGHSALRLETGDQCVLLDPMLGNWVAPIPFLGHRFPYLHQPLPDTFGHVDLIVLSHDHYDHLDRETILKLAPVTDHYLTPLGVGIHLQAWGIEESKITELDWWETARIGGVDYTLTPARHFGGRSPGMRNKSLWGGYAIRISEDLNLYFGGDSGYGRHFKEIGRRLGPFQLTMLDSGQYHDRWQGVHMHPEESLRAHHDLRGEKLLPIHWAGFTLSNHPWADPIRRILAADDSECVITPAIGERVRLGTSEDYACKRWWEEEMVGG